MVVASIAVTMAETMAEIEAARAFDVEQDWEVAETGSTMDTAQKTLLVEIASSLLCFCS